jgi:hypothetical protein
MDNVRTEGDKIYEYLQRDSVKSDGDGEPELTRLYIHR